MKWILLYVTKYVQVLHIKELKTIQKEMKAHKLNEMYHKLSNFLKLSLENTYFIEYWRISLQPWGKQKCNNDETWKKW